MGWITRPSRIAAGLEMVPPTLMIAMGHPWLGAATLGGVLAASALQSWIVVRSAQERHRAVLSYAQDATSMGNDPAPVIAALRGNAAGDDDESPGVDDEGRSGHQPWLGPPRMPDR